MKKDKLLVIATTFPRWENDKEATFVKDLCKEQSKDFEVHVLVPHYKNLKLREKVDNLYIHRFVYFFPRYQKLAYGGILPNIKKNRLLIFQAPFLFISMLFNTMKIIKKEKIRIIHAHWFFPQGLIAAICNKYLKTKSVVTIHAGCVTGLSNILVLKRWISDFTVKNTDVIISVSNFGKELLESMVSKKIKEIVKKKTKIIPMGVYTKDFKIKINKNQLKKKYKIKQKTIILFLGRLAEKKGVKYLIKALPLIKNKDYILLIGGDGPLKKELQVLIDKHKLKDKVKFLGYITGKEKINFILLSDILAIPSIITKEGDTEGLQVTIMEGTAAGLPIITTNVGGIKDIIKNNQNGILIQEKNPKQIAEKIDYLINNKKFAQKISRNALMTSKGYDWERIGEKNIKLLKKLI